MDCSRLVKTILKIRAWANGEARIYEERIAHMLRIVSNNGGISMASKQCRCGSTEHEAVTSRGLAGMTTSQYVLLK